MKRPFAIPRLSFLLPVLLALLSGLLVAKVSYRFATAEARAAVERLSDDGPSPAGSQDRPDPRPRDGSTAPDDVPLFAVRIEAGTGANGLGGFLPRAVSDNAFAPTARRSGEALAPSRSCVRNPLATASVPPPAWTVSPPFAPRAPPFIEA